ncbi:MAG TPA: L,D-transpeptidase family protein [Candidatus Kapabacteria bacterium]|nr:L,D-transpeptidase family protein [Candidatus Kapabacteria bacterium]
MRFLFTILFTLNILVVSSCQNDNSKELIKTDSTKIDEVIDTNKIIKQLDTFPIINYKKVYVESQAHRSKLLKEFAYDSANPAINKAVRTINRKELRYMRVGDTILVPDKYIEDMIAYSVFPYFYPAAHKIAKIIMVSNKWQSYACYEYGKLVRFAAVSSGKERTQTYAGRYSLVWKDRLRRSSLDSSWILPYTWNFHKYAGSAFHKFDMPGYPASHSCIRQFMDDAKWLFTWGKGAKYDTNKVALPFSGTPVIIIDFYDFAKGRNGDWKHLNSNKDFYVSLPEQPMKVEEALIPISQIPKNSRGALPNRNRYLYAEDSLRANGHIREGVQITPSVNFNVLKRQKAAAKRKKDSLNKIHTKSE